MEELHLYDWFFFTICSDQWLISFLTVSLSFQLVYYYHGLTPCGVYREFWWGCRERLEEWQVVLMISIHPPPSISPRCKPQPLISSLMSNRCNRTQQKGRSIGVIIDRSEWRITERSAPIDSHIIALRPLCCCVLVINYKSLQDASTPASF